MYVSAWAMHICYSLHEQTVKHVVMLSPHDKPTWHFTKMDHQKRELYSKDKNATTNQKNDNAGSEIHLKVNGVTEETANWKCWHFYCSRNYRYAVRGLR